MFGVVKGKYTVLALAMAVFTVLAFWQSSAVGQGIQRGMQLCLDTVVPSLFFYLFLCEWLIRSGASAALAFRVGWLFRPLMGKGYGAFPALLLCMVGGYPAGAIALKRMEQQGELTGQQVSALSLFFFLPSPAFAAVGVGRLLGSAKAGWLLWIGCAVPMLLIAALGCRIVAKRYPFPVALYSKSVHPNAAFAPSVAGAAKNLLMICAMVLLFSGLGEWIARLPLPFGLGEWLLATGEITSGSTALLHKGLPSLAAALSFGGFCTHIQIQGILQKSMPAYWLYESIRLLQSAAAYGITYGLCRLFPQVLPTFAPQMPLVPAKVGFLPSAALLVTCVVFLGSFTISESKSPKGGY